MNNSRLKSYVYGFVFSLVLTLIAYVAVVNNVWSVTVVTGLILALAIVQLIVQLTFFLHLNHEQAPRLNSFIFFTTLSGIFILVAGSIWIMNHLNYNMTPKEMTDFLTHDEGIHN